ncbi:PaaI family thioesterase [Lacinutrix iliipiscaria]|uniref:PaaI family thioesterase n=1 Tax=Lacinutrix iliipiscaria TaxID=1230532 RepID=A0ABW5WM29_9FLAO
MNLSKSEMLAKANEISKGTLLETLGIEIIDYGEDFLVARMAVTPRLHQPDGVLHGGATAALAESVGSFAAHLFLDIENKFVRGIEITANHLKAVTDGYVYAKATFIHKGRTTQLFDIRVTDDHDNLVSVCRLSTISLSKPT